MSHLPKTLLAASTALGAAVAAFAVALTPSANAATAGVPSAGPTAKGREATTSTVALPALTKGAADARTADAATAEVTREDTKDFGLVGLSWARGTGTSGVTVQVRTRTDGTWSIWTDLHTDHEDGPTAPGEREGTEPLWVGQADGVAARVTSTSGTAPKDVRIDLVDPGTDPAGAQPVSDPAAKEAATAAGRYIPRPAMFSRSGWGAKAARSCDSPRISSHTMGLVVHHTAGSNSYSKSQSAAIVRGVQAFHQNGRGWCDIGYNFLVDKYGQVFEGRDGAVEGYLARGAHAGNRTVNTYTLGISLMGNLDTASPSSAMKTATVNLASWWLGTHYLPATGDYAIAGKALARISGHRDVYNRGIRPGTSTACPGRYGYAWLPSMRTRVAELVADYDTPIKAKYKSLGGSTTGPVYRGEYAVAGGHKTAFTNGNVYYKNETTGAAWVKGAVGTTYNQLGGPSGALGFPTGDAQGSGDRKTQTFQKGTVYKVSETAAYGLTANVDAKYRELGGYDSELGSPTSTVEVSPKNVDRVFFTNGAIRYVRATGEYKVTYD